MAKIYSLESGIHHGTKNDNREKFFEENKFFVIKKDENNRLAFINLDGYQEMRLNGKPSPKNCWVTTPAKCTDSNDIWQRWETESGTIYNIVESGTIIY